MHKIIKLFSLTLLVTGTFTACKKDERSLSLNVTAVGSLSAPSDNSTIKLDPVAGADIVFQWSPATTPDSGVVLYEVAFDKSDGDFSNPIYKVLADGGGVQTQASVSQKNLNKIGAVAGIASSSTGTIKWAILASKATNAVLSKQINMLTLQRPAGFAVPPDSLFITGTATEAGNDLTKAIALKKTADGAFEIYTSLKAGNYLLTDHQNATGTTYFIDGNTIKEGTTPTNITGTQKAYHLTYDFNIAVAATNAIDSIGLFMSAYNTSVGTLSYIGNSTWEAAKIPIVFYQFDWGKDDRYKFIVHTSSGDEYWGSSNANNNPPAGQPASYFYLWPVTNDQWNNTYKFDPSADGANIKADLYFQPAADYTHVITVL